MCSEQIDCVQVSVATSAQASPVRAGAAEAAGSLPATVPLAVGQVAAAAAGEVVALRAECAHMDEQLVLVSAQLAAVNSERDSEQCDLCCAACAGLRKPCRLFVLCNKLASVLHCRPAFDSLLHEA